MSVSVMLLKSTWVLCRHQQGKGLCNNTNALKKVQGIHKILRLSYVLLYHLAIYMPEHTRKSSAIQNPWCLMLSMLLQ